MAFSPLSFLLGVGAAYAFPSVSKNIRPIVIEAAATAIGWMEGLRRVTAEQLENLEDLAAEVRARREQLTAGNAAGSDIDGAEDDGAAEEGAEPTPGARPRKRGAGRNRSRTS